MKCVSAHGTVAYNAAAGAQRGVALALPRNAASARANRITVPAASTAITVLYSESLPVRDVWSQ